MVMAPLIISHDGAVHRDTVRRWKDFVPDINVDWVRMAKNVLWYNVVIAGKFSNKGSWTPRNGEKITLMDLRMNLMARLKEMKRRKMGENDYTSSVKM